MNQGGHNSRVPSLVTLLGVAVAFSACDSSPSTPQLAEDARIFIEGTTPNPLQLIVSTDFVELFDDVAQAFVVGFNSADTMAIDLPFDQRLPVPLPGDLLVRLTQLDTTTASVAMQVFINGSLQYDQSATLADTASLEFRFFSAR